MKTARAFELWEDLSTPENLARNLVNYHPDSSDPHFQRAVGYSLAAAGYYDEALESLNDCHNTLHELKSKQPATAWYGELLSEVDAFRELILTNPLAARDQLDKWTEITKGYLKLAATD